MLGLPLASLYFLLCPEWQCSLRSLLLWFMNWDMFHQREWLPGGGEKGFDLTVLLKYDCKIRIRWQSLWGRDIFVCPAQCLACFGCHVINNRSWVMGAALKSCLLTLKSSLLMLLLIVLLFSPPCSIVTGPCWALWLWWDGATAEPLPGVCAVTGAVPSPGQPHVLLYKLWFFCGIHSLHLALSPSYGFRKT